MTDSGGLSYALWVPVILDYAILFILLIISAAHAYDADLGGRGETEVWSPLFTVGGLLPLVAGAFPSPSVVGIAMAEEASLHQYWGHGCVRWWPRMFRN